jgi:hypothetical protein
MGTEAYFHPWIYFDPQFHNFSLLWSGCRTCFIAIVLVSHNECPASVPIEGPPFKNDNRNTYLETKDTQDTSNLTDLSLFLCRELFVNPKTGEFFHHGDWIRPKKFCETLKIIASNGGNCLYNGSLAKMFVSDIQNMGGIITEEDMANYRYNSFHATVYFEIFCWCSLSKYFIFFVLLCNPWLHYSVENPSIGTCPELIEFLFT